VTVLDQGSDAVTALEQEAGTMSSAPHGGEPASRSVFRPEAVRRHTLAQEEAVLPQFVSPHTFACLWLVLGLLGVATAAAWTVRLPSYLTVTAVIGRQHGGTGQEVIAALVPPSEIKQVHLGQRLLIAVGGRQLDRPIVGLDPVLHSPAALRRELGLGGSGALVLSGPAGVAVVPLQPLPSRVRADEYRGSVLQGQIETGSVRALSLLSFLGPLVRG
jgi:hypothetical protein